MRPTSLADSKLSRIQNDLKILTERLSRINDSLARKVAARNEYDQTIQETEAAYLKVRDEHLSSAWQVRAVVVWQCGNIWIPSLLF